MCPSCVNSKIDPHVHTAETSHCGQLTGKEVVETYHALGYQAIAITDHLHEEYISSLAEKDDWQACVDQFLQGYQNAKTAGEALGLTVILGAEIRFAINDSDYLLYGFAPDFLYNHPYLYRHSPEEFFTRFGQDILIIQAHPYRYNHTVFTHAIHGVEVYNTNPRHNSRNEMAQALCVDHPHFHQFSGSDTHRHGDAGGTGMILPRPVTDSIDFRKIILTNEYSTIM